MLGCPVWNIVLHNLLSPSVRTSKTLSRSQWQHISKSSNARPRRQRSRYFSRRLLLAGLRRLSLI
jgi:hypothetical protein